MIINPSYETIGSIFEKNILLEVPKYKGMPRIIKNAIRCKKCGEVIESKTVHDFKFCSCGSCAVDGGHDYLRRCGNRENWEELSEVEKVEDNGALT